MVSRALLSDRSAAIGAEFAMVLPLLLILLFTVIDGGRYMWEVNRAEKATQMGARYAVVTDPVAGGFNDTSITFVGYSGLAQGDRIPASAVSDISCTSSACSACASCPTGFPGAFNSTAFNAILARVQDFYPNVKAENLVVEYRGSGIGFAGDPNVPEVSPLVTVKLTGMTFQPLTTFLFANLPLPSFATTLTAEDLSGSQSH